MLAHCRHLLLAGLLLTASLPAVGQTESAVGSLDVVGRVKVEGKVEKLSRKRFYLVRGGLQENKALVDRIKAAEITSRDCYYTQAKASPQLICWLQAENCESPYCRDIDTAAVERVPEFQTAYKKGLTQFRARAPIALDWLTTHLSANLLSGYYRRQKTLIGTVLGTVKPIQSSMTDSVTVKAIFIDIPVSGSDTKKGETFLVSNVLPIEIGMKSYVWTCEIDISRNKPAVLRLPEPGKPVKNCDVSVRDLGVCKTGSCEQK